MQYEFNGLAGQGILVGTEYERYWPFRDEPAYEKDCATWLKVLAGVATALLAGAVVGALVFLTGGLATVALGVTAVQLGVYAGAVAAGVGVAAVASTWYHDKKNGTVSSLGDYVRNAVVASAEVGAAFVGINLSLYAADLLTLMVTGGLPLILVGGNVITLGEIRLFAWLMASGISLRNLFYQLNDVGMFIFDEKPLRALTGDVIYDTEKGITEALTLQLGYLGVLNPYLYENAISNINELFVVPTPNTELVVPMDSGTAFAISGLMTLTSQQMYNTTIVAGNSVPLLTQRDFNQLSNTQLSSEGSKLHPNVPIWKQGDPAYGILKIGNQEIPLRSGAAGPGQYLKILPRGKGSGINAQIPTHVEGHVAGIMRQTGIKEAELFINKPPCATGVMCRYNLNKILPPDSMLTVHFLDENGNITTWLFKLGKQNGR